MTPNQRTLYAIELAYADGSQRIVCPVCMGGSNQEECMSLWTSDDGDLMATCHRAHCSVGTIPITKDRHYERPKFKKPPTYESNYYRIYAQLDSDMRSRLSRKYAFQFSDLFVSAHMRMLLNKHRQGLVFLMRGPDQTEQGVIVKPTNSDWTGPKSLTYKNDPNYSGMSWYMAGHDVGSEHLFVVEDCLSAIALRQASDNTCVSLNGTLLNDERIEELLQYKWKIVLMLDADATRKAIQYAQKYGPDVIRVVRLQHDIKNMTNEEVDELLNREGLL